jgi:hypothetical protein
MDGTFDTSPLFMQLFTIHGDVADIQMPMVFVLMAAKTSQMYCDVFRQLKILCQQQVGQQLQPLLIMSDYESGLIPAVSLEFPTARHKGCHFHYCQVRIQLSSLNYFVSCRALTCKLLTGAVIVDLLHDLGWHNV